MHWISAAGNLSTKIFPQPKRIPFPHNNYTYRITSHTLLHACYSNSDLDCRLIVVVHGLES